MHFLINSPASRKRRVAKSVKAVKMVDKKRPRRYRPRKSLQRSAASTPATPRHAKAGFSMATRRRRSRATVRRMSTGRKRRRRAAVTHVNAPKRRRRRRAVAFSANPAHRRRRRRRSVFATNRRRTRRYRRNPGLGNITSIITEGVKDGATVFVAQVATRKIGAGLNAMVPASLGAGSAAIRGIGTRLAAAVAVAMIARKVSPARAKLATAGAFAEVVNFAVAQSPTATSFLSAFPSRRVINRTPAGRPGVSAYPRGAALSRGGVGAYPMRSVGMPVQVG